MKGSILGFSTDGAIELAFRLATALPTLETTCHSEGNHLLVNALGTILDVSVATGDSSGLGPSNSIVVAHKVWVNTVDANLTSADTNMKVNLKQVTVKFVVTPTLSTTMSLNSGIVGCRAWFSGLLVGVNVRTGQPIVRVRFFPRLCV
ncbi:hypothetical protein PTTG_29642 [Puccinia triticina 1-1 BBBD Race 1]|uniref:Uncharacterized protein n=1 Tax=Puccinia triticina (isolate 1-1 / race 1 (BBBD)) TaxID=630390 RepID=A0A180G3F4_PUCT1|nr:hypothetical protein PTTG_29642 [Puccinia triticina 1-1 BBBD Race 1]